MGLLGKLFGGEKQARPAFEATHPSASRIEAQKQVLESFARKVHDKLEIVPGKRATYVFIGRPPDAFGIAWFEGAEEHNLKRLMAEKKLSQLKINSISEELRQAYRRTTSEPRYSYTLAGKSVVVTPSEVLESEIVKIIHEVEA